MQLAKIKNQFWIEFIVPLHRARTMHLNKEIQSYELVEVDSALNIEKSETQSEFEDRIKREGKK